MSSSLVLFVEILNRKNRFDSSVGRGDFKTAIGVGKVIKGICLLKDLGSSKVV